MKIIKLTSLIIFTFACFELLSTAWAGGTPQPPPTSQNTWYGYQALFSDATGDNNSAYGFKALFRNTIGANNTAVGSQALLNNTNPPDGNGNAAVGFQSLFSNTVGDSNNALGTQALFSNIDGIRNNAVGTGALLSLTTGDANTAVGSGAMSGSGVVNYNTAVGRRALTRTQADQNTALGFFAGSNLRDGGTNNIYIGNVGPDPIGTESNTIRLGTQIPTTATVATETHPMPQHTDTYVAGIFGSSTITPGMPVYVDSNGKLGTLPSSERFKDDVKPMNDASAEIFALKPVTFRYKSEVMRSEAPQFGLVAEDVGKVDPDLVVRDTKGKIQSVRYEAVNAMLLNEFIKEHRQVQEQQKQIGELTAQLKEQASMLQKVSAQVELMKASPKTVADSR